MNNKQIDYILEVAETKNFRRAAENLYVSQPTITYQINEAENEIGFKIFDRSGKGATLTPAGEQFCVTLREVRQQMKEAIEQGQNFSAAYQENIRICMPIRSSLYYLPQAMEQFMREDESITITPSFDWYHGTESFLTGDQDILFAIRDEVSHVPDIRIHELYDSRIYFVCNNTDKLAKKKLIHADDLKGRTLMVGGGSQAPLRIVQQRVIRETGISYFNSSDHDTSLTNVAAHRAIVLSPGFLNDHSGMFTWIPFDCKETIPCVLCTHVNDNRWSVNRFISLLQKMYKETKLPL